MNINLDDTYKPTERQAAAHANPARFKLFGGAMGGGKSVWLVMEVFRLLTMYPGNRAVLARYHLSDFKNTTLVTLLKFFPKEIIKSHNKTEHVIELVNGSTILYMGLSEEQDVSKFKSMEFGVFGFDEASEIPKSQFDLAKTRLRWKLDGKTRPPYYGLLTSNPEDCWLKDVFLKDKDGRHAFIPSLPKDYPHLPKDYKSNFSDMPDDWFDKYWMGSWDDLDSGDTVIPKEWINLAVNRIIPKRNVPVIGCDIARFGDDETVIYYAEGGEVKDCDIYIKKGLDETVSRITRLANRNQYPMNICTDDIGLGGGVTDFLGSMNYPVDGINVGKRAEDQRFFNMKAQLWWNAREMFRDGKVSLPNDEKLIRQLGAVKYRYRGTGKVIVEPKDDTKKRLGSSPDRADALVLTLWASRFLLPQSHDYNRQMEPQAIYQDNYGWDEVYSDNQAASTY